MDWLSSKFGISKDDVGVINKRTGVVVVAGEGSVNGSGGGLSGKNSLQSNYIRGMRKQKTPSRASKSRHILLSQTLRLSIIGFVRFHFSVRKGKRWFTRE